MNTIGLNFRLTTYGESHGLAVGGIIDGCPSGMVIDKEAIRSDLARRRQGAPRQEEDEIEWLSGVTYPTAGTDGTDGSTGQMVTLGTPIAFSIRNKNMRSKDYDVLRDAYRPGHADYTYQARYGIRDYRGGGRASARETVARVVAGSIAKQVIAPVEVHAEVDTLGPDNEMDTRGGTIRCRISGLKAGIGNPVFNKLNARLALAMMSIPSAIGFEMGAGFKAAEMTGSEYIDRWNPQAHSQPDTQPLTLTNHCGGIQGGITNGMPVEFRVAFHPVASLPVEVECLTEDGTLRPLTIGGRHDRCQVQRASVVVEAMAALTVADFLSVNHY